MKGESLTPTKALRTELALLVAMEEGGRAYADDTVVCITNHRIIMLSPLTVQIAVDVDADSWKTEEEPTRECPPEIRGLNSPCRATSVEAALLFTAICTRPPVFTGFSLADRWAWLRYRPALDIGPQLRLLPEWNDIDAHQKTILSDDFGMGFSVELLANSLGFQDVADTFYVVKLTTDYTLERTGKTGPSKSPDFLLTNTSGEVIVLECKGTQNTRKALTNALEGGFDQKDNLGSTGSKIIKHALVAGLFIPQSTNPESALIQVRDPEPKDLIELLANTQLPTLQLVILQVSLAKQLNLMGLHSWANVLASTPTRELEQAHFPDVLDPPVQLENGSPHFTQVYNQPTTSGNQNEGGSGIAFAMSLSAKVYELLRSSENLAVALSSLSQFRSQRTWEFIQTGSRSLLLSPLGFTLSLEYR